MQQYTTPTIRLAMSSDITFADEVFVTFGTRGKKFMTKTGDEITVSAEYVDVFLTQEESASFPKGDVQVEVNFTFFDSVANVMKRGYTNKATIFVDRNLLDEVIE